MSAAGSLRARTTAHPWSLQFLDRRARWSGTGLPRGGLRFCHRPAGFAPRACCGPAFGPRPPGLARHRRSAGPPAALRMRARRGRCGRAARGRDRERVAEGERVGIAFRARPGERYLGFGERSNAVDQRGPRWRTTWPRGPSRPTSARSSRLRAALGLSPARRRHLLPRCPGCSPAPATACWSTTARRACSTSDRRGSAPGASRSRRAELRLRVFAGPRPADVLRRLTAAHRPPAARRRRRSCSAPGTSRATTRRRSWTRLQRARRAALGGADLHPLPALRGPARPRGRGAGAGGALPRRGAGRDHLLQPDDLHRAHRATASRGRRGAGARTRRAALRLPLHHARELRRRPVRLHRAAAGATSTGGSCGEASADGHDGWMEDFGEYTPLDARFADGSDGSGAHNLYPSQYHCARRTARAPRALRASCARAGPAPRPARRSSGAATRRVDWGFDGLRSVGDNGLTMGLSGVSTWGSDIGGFFALVREPPDPRAAYPLDPARRRVRGDAHPGQRHPHSRQPRAADLGPRDAAGHWRRWAKLRTQLYPYLAAADAELPPHRLADHAPPRARLSRATGVGRARGRVHVRPRPAGRAGA